MLLGTLGASLLGNLLTGKGFLRAGSGNNKGKGVVRAGYGNKNKGEGVVRAEEIKKFIGNKNIKANIYRLQATNSVMCGYFCIGFIDFMFAGKTLIEYTNMFSPYDFNKNDSIIFTYSKYA